MDMSPQRDSGEGHQKIHKICDPKAVPSVMPLSLDKLRRIRVFVAILLILNTIVGALVIWTVHNIHSKSLPDQTVRQQVDLIEQKIAEIYDEQKRSDTPGSPVYVDTEPSPEHPSLKFLSLLKPVSLFSGLKFYQKKKANQQRQEFSVLRNWASSEGSERNLLWNGMTYENGSLSVPAEGVYHVHCHIKFYVESNNPDDKIRQFEHKIFRYNAKSEQEELVVRNTVSECKEGINGGAHLEYSSNLSSLIQLNPGDALKIKVTDATLLKHDRDWHNFGAYLI